MPKSERAINDGLQDLGDAYRLGRISREEYRARRRHLLIGAGDEDGFAAPSPRTPDVTVRAKPAAPAGGTGLAGSAPGSSPVAWWLVYVLGGVILLLVGVVFWLLSGHGAGGA